MKWVSYTRSISSRIGEENPSNTIAEQNERIARYLKKLDHVWIVDFEQVEVILQESEWKRFFPEEWLNNGEEDCNGKKE